MGNLLSYSGLTTKLKAMEGKLLKEEDYQVIAECTTVPQSVTYLKTKSGYKQIWAHLDESKLHRGEIEKLLINSVYQSFTSIYQFADVTQRKFLDLYFYRYKSSIVKTCLSHIFDHRDIEFDVSIYKEFFQRHSRLDYDLITTSTTIEEFVTNLKGSAFYEPLRRLEKLEKPTLFDYEMAVDLYVFRKIWDEKNKILKGKELEQITKAYGSKFDLINLQWIYRAKKYYHMTNVDIYALLIPIYYKLKRSDISAMVEAESLDEFHAALEKTYYGHQYQEISTATLEVVYIKVMKCVLRREAKVNPYSAVSIYSYLYHKEHEIDRLTTALECIRYGITPTETLSFVHKT